MRILVLGGDGMLGHQLVLTLGSRHQVAATLRKNASAYKNSALFQGVDTKFGVDLRSSDLLEPIVEEFRPDAIVNAVGIVKQRDEAEDPQPSILINALLPHRIADIAEHTLARVIHISTDCVFSGTTGNYNETSPPDPVDIYGHTKLLGELANRSGCLTLRTSMIGYELFRKASLLEWFLAADCPISGYSKAIFSGLTTIELARVIESLIVNHTDLTGLFHLAADPIDKFSLLSLIRDALRPDCEIVEDATVQIDRSLAGRKFNAATGYQPPSWADMVAELAAARATRPERVEEPN